MEKPVRKYNGNHTGLLDALAAIESGAMTTNRASKHFEELSNKINGVHTKKVGRPRTFTDEQEKEICDILQCCAKVGAPLNKRKLMEIVRAIALHKGIDEGKFGSRWHRDLLGRHKEVSLRTLCAVSMKKSREWTRDRCEGWIKLLQEYDDDGYLSNPDGTWNLDESGFKVAEMYDKGYAQKGTPNVTGYVKGSASDRDNMTLLAVGNASGKMLRPLILYSDKLHIESHFDETDDQCFLSTNASGVMDTFVLTDYLEKEWLPSLTCEKNILFYDGHSSHLNCLALLAACMERSIEVVSLPSGQTSCLQPLGKKVFGGVKQKWRQYLQDSRMNTDIDAPNASPYSFNLGGPLKHGFELTGIFPFSSDVLRATVDPNLPVDEDEDEDQEVIAREYHYGEISKILQESLGLDEDKTRTCLIQIKQIVQRASAAQVIATDFHAHLLKAAPKKKRQLKDSRLDPKHGLALTRSEFIRVKLDAIRKAKEQKAKTKKQNKKDAVARPDDVPVSAKKNPRTRKATPKTPKTSEVPVDSSVPSTSKAPGRARLARTAKKAVESANSALKAPPKPRKPRAKKQ
ncbi:hypothetical protein RvY_14269 [Ramazzottius varieornatus]|uniref:DDE-1 domain-containing protein n=1 Tax=Ramazzottius varieornatus TaxID=947166 RepID=A0A1D1VY02_RAMVA|nr:hypothetical protein RvY_14269 [Ramazzottius varieornatus]